MSEISKKIELSYINYISLHNKRPNSINDLISNELESEEEKVSNDFYDLDLIESKIWEDGIFLALKFSEDDPNYDEYSVREKLLSFYYNYVEVLKKNDLFYQYSANINSLFELSIINNRTSFLKNTLSKNINKIIQEGISTGEIADRYFITNYYSDILFYQSMIIIKYYLTDTSNEKENSDEIIEKSVNLIMDLLEPNFTDSAFLFAKFLIQK